MHKFLNARTAVMMAVVIICVACGKLSRQAKEIVGVYYNTELSQTVPVMELKPDASCLIRAIRPGVLTYTVEGTWNVENDSLILNLDPKTLEWEGDSLMIGDIPVRNARKISSHSDFALHLEQNGATYMFKRQIQH